MSRASISLSHVAKGVDKNFRSDWPYLILASRINSALSLATIFSLIAILTRFSSLEELGRFALYCFLIASISYLTAIAIIVRFAPAFLREFPNYSNFKAQDNSHRWILWEFYHGVQESSGGLKLLPETISKNLSVNINSLSRSGLPIKKAFKSLAHEELFPYEDKTKTERYQVRLYEPVNFDRDLLFGFAIFDAQGGEKRYVLPIREKDKEVEAKCKELFWILFTAAAKEHPYARRLAWLLLRLSGLFLLAAAAFAIYNVAFVDGVGEQEYCCLHLVELRLGTSGVEGIIQ